MEKAAKIHALPFPGAGILKRCKSPDHTFCHSVLDEDSPPRAALALETEWLTGRRSGKWGWGVLWAEQGLSGAVVGDGVRRGGRMLQWVTTCPI